MENVGKGHGIALGLSHWSCLSESISSENLQEYGIALFFFTPLITKIISDPDPDYVV